MLCVLFLCFSCGLPYNFDQFVFVAFDIGCVLPDNLTFTVEDKGMGRIHYIHGAFEVLVLVDVYFVFPSVTVDMGLDTGSAAGIVDRDGFTPVSSCHSS